MVNLLPPQEKGKLLVRYYMNLSGTLFISMALVVFVGALLLLPSYLLVTDRAGESATYLRALETAQSARQKSDTGKSVSLFSERLGILKSFERKPATVSIIESLKKNLPDDMKIGNIKINFLEQGKGSVVIQGVAKTRTSLLSYAESLREEKIFTGVTVPVTQLANDANIKYSLEFGFITP